jgi:hypothetical protein
METRRLIKLVKAPNATINSLAVKLCVSPEDMEVILEHELNFCQPQIQKNKMSQWTETEMNYLKILKDLYGNDHGMIKKGFNDWAVIKGFITRTKTSIEVVMARL